MKHRETRESCTAGLVRLLLCLNSTVTHYIKVAASPPMNMALRMGSLYKLFVCCTDSVRFMCWLLLSFVLLLMVCIAIVRCCYLCVFTLRVC